MEHYYIDDIAEYAAKGNLESIRVLINVHQEFNDEIFGEILARPMLAASENGHRNVVEYLMECGSNLEVYDENGVIACDC
ncbi:unnamed protein product [Enterobius vermicularis]|uniref:ANK_REP_REGION domain-containing protein n=1 Tax=Enterobius vermicularis TaxID=51028 RepID=A0A0N4USK4_ENTVE|nr:unnamed protein product [Enterobius vermicularis]